MTRLTDDQLQSLLAGCEGADEVLLVSHGMSASVPKDVFVSAITELMELRKSAKAVEDWWVGEDMGSKLGGAPYCIFAIRSALNPKAPK